MPERTTEHARDGRLAAAISTGMVGLLRDYTGRGPVRARTTVDDNLVVCVLGDTLTKSEHTLVEAGREKHVLRGRRAIQDTMEADAIALVEGLTDRDVVAFMSNNHIEPDLRWLIPRFVPCLRGFGQRGRSRRCLVHRRPGGHDGRRPRHSLHRRLLHGGRSPA